MSTLRTYRLRRFASWCIQGISWGWWWRFDLSLLSTTYIGAVQRRDVAVQQWSRPVYDAFLAGAWILHWTDETLFWVAKPTVHVEMTPAGQRLHNANGPALESAVEPLYFWHGVLVPSFVVIRPDLLTVAHITNEGNAEVRRVMVERFGMERYVRESGAAVIDRSDYGTLYRASLADDEPLVMVEVINASPEPDGSFKPYLIRVPPTMERARDAVAWTFPLPDGTAYAPGVQT